MVVHPGVDGEGRGAGVAGANCSVRGWKRKWDRGQDTGARWKVWPRLCSTCIMWPECYANDGLRGTIEVKTVRRVA